jgi:septum formation protein
MKRSVELILASGSPRRKKILEDAGYILRVVPSGVEETLPPAGDARAVACANSLKKALAVAETLESGLVVGSDTVVALGNGIIGKPVDAADARRILARLSGTCHSVVSGVAVVDAATGRSGVTCDETLITMCAMTGAEIDGYVASGEALGKAGAYAIQETGDRFVERIEGSFSNVVGFPLEIFEGLLAGFIREDGQ